ncbi:hypothetical protein H0H81_010451, partial [Sphagnurus paluster]
MQDEALALEEAQDVAYMTRLDHLFAQRHGTSGIASEMQVPEPLDEEDETIVGDEDDEMLPPVLQEIPTADGLLNRYVRVIHTNGMHYLPLVYCACQGHEIIPIDLMHARLVPTSFVYYRTIFTAAALDDFRLTNLECKASAFQYWEKLQRSTVGGGNSMDLDNFY